MTSRPIYMDHNATTPVDPRVLEAMLPCFGERFGNPSSRSHFFGWEAEEAVERAREQVATLLGAASSKEIVFTSGATESDNLAIKGVIEATPDKRHLVTTAIEHKAVLDSCKHLGRRGIETTIVPVDATGAVDPEAIERAMREDTALVSVMLASNEVGTIQPIEAIGRIAKRRGVLFHCDAVQGLGRIPIDVEAMGVDLVSVSAHKMHGPKGVGALYVRRRGPRVKLVAQMDGGGQERGMRAGTLNVPGIVGLGKAAELAANELERDAAHLAALRDRLWDRLRDGIEGAVLNGAPFERRHPGNLNVSFPHAESEALMIALKDTVAVSSGSACASASIEPSYVLRAMGVDEDLAHASIRFGLGRFNTEAEVDAVAARVVSEVARLRELDPSYRLKREGVPVDW